MGLPRVATDPPLWPFSCQLRQVEAETSYIHVGQGLIDQGPSRSDKSKSYIDVATPLDPTKM